jgi:D-alanyl-D-alanine carboxypeptidase
MLKRIKKIASEIPVHILVFFSGFLTALLFIVLLAAVFAENLDFKEKNINSQDHHQSEIDVSQDLNYDNLAISHLEASLSPQGLPIPKTDVLPPQLTAQAALIIDFNQGRVLFEKNSNLKLQIGSLTKLASAIVALENLSLDTVIKLKEQDVSFYGSVLRFFAGEQYLVESLLKFALIESNNNAIYAIANFIGKDEFVAKMNQLAQRIGLKNTSFQNPAGLDNENNYSTAYDIALLLNYTNNFPLIKNILALQSASIYSLDKRKITIKNTNQLINNQDIIAAKTGTTEKAGQNYAAFVRAPDQRELVIVILNAKDRYKDVKNLLSWLKDGFVWE